MNIKVFIVIDTAGDNGIRILAVCGSESKANRLVEILRDVNELKERFEQQNLEIKEYDVI